MSMELVLFTGATAKEVYSEAEKYALKINNNDGSIAELFSMDYFKADIPSSFLGKLIKSKMEFGYSTQEAMDKTIDILMQLCNNKRKVYSVFVLVYFRMEIYKIISIIDHASKAGNKHKTFNECVDGLKKIFRWNKDKEIDIIVERFADIQVNSFAVTSKGKLIYAGNYNGELLDGLDKAYNSSLILYFEG